MFPFLVTDPQSGVTFCFDVTTAAYFDEFPHLLGCVRSVIEYIVPSLVETILENNTSQSVDVYEVLTGGLGVSTSAAIQVADQMDIILQTLRQIRLILRGRDPGLPRPTTVLEKRLAEVRDVASFVAASNILETPSANRDLRCFQKSCVQLCTKALLSSRAFSVKKFRQKTILALDASSRLVHDIAVSHGFLHFLVVAFPHQQNFMVRSMAQRAAINFANECRRILEAASPGAVPYICGQNSEQTAAAAAAFEWFHTSRIVTYQALIFDEWRQNVDTSYLSKDLLVLLSIVRDAYNTPQIQSLAKEIHQRYPRRLFLQGFVSHRVLTKAHEVAQMPPPLRNLTTVYRFLIKQQATNAVLSPEGFDLDTTLRFFQNFYKNVQPPIHSSAILTLRVYEVYRNVCNVFKLNPNDFPSMSDLFQSPSETLVFDPVFWCPAPIPIPAAAAAVAECLALLPCPCPCPWLPRLVSLYLDYKKQDLVSLKEEITT